VCALHCTRAHHCTQSFIVLWALLLFKLLYFDLAEVHIDDHAMRINR
jgi:hypothetical protein